MFLEGEWMRRLCYLCRCTYPSSCCRQLICPVLFQNMSSWTFREYSWLLQNEVYLIEFLSKFWNCMANACGAYLVWRSPERRNPWSGAGKVSGLTQNRQEVRTLFGHIDGEEIWYVFRNPKTCLIYDLKVAAIEVLERKWKSDGWRLYSTLT